MERFKVVFYEKEDGSRPAYDFINTLSDKMRAKIYKAASLLEVEGAQTRMPYSEYLKDGIFQIRAQQEGNITRVLYFFTVGKLVILTNGFTKKTNRTPSAEIERAKRYRADYERREAKKNADFR
ncbi:MAG: type II toxin-antitoxin system RelE/ParE family toxin [Oscillibacter sp.]|nr:type II toxin-antitoxin system RelE/ParE family toxin [Oscillibacter sp.]